MGSDCHKTAISRTKSRKFIVAVDLLVCVWYKSIIKSFSFSQFHAELNSIHLIVILKLRSVYNSDCSLATPSINWSFQLIDPEVIKVQFDEVPISKLWTTC